MKHTLPGLLLAAATLVAVSSANAAILTFDSSALGSLGAVNGTATNAAFSGTDGWSASTSGGTGTIVTTTTSGEYVGGQALGVTGASVSYIGGNVNPGIINYTGTNTITFDAFCGTANASTVTAGFLGDTNTNGLFDQAGGVGMNFGFNASGFMYRDADYSTTTQIAGAPALAANTWYRISVNIGDLVAGNRTFTMGVRNLTTATDLDMNGASAGNLFSATITGTAFGIAPESALGVSVRTTNGAASSAYIDNLNFTAVPEPSTYGLIGAGALAAVAMVRRRRKAAGIAA